MDSTDKLQVIKKFKNGEIVLLVATTVIEVGIDIQDATLIIIENAERFGLAQLHQLRGRVGRGYTQSYCILLYEFWAGNVRHRLNIMQNNSDGFIIAEKDLALRGGGDTLGTKQSGNAEFVFLNLEEDNELFDNFCIEKDDVEKLKEKYYEFNISDQKNIDFLIKIFGNDNFHPIVLSV